MGWLSLDEGDAELRTFLTHLVAAVQVASREAVGAEALALMDTEGDVPVEDVVVSPEGCSAKADSRLAISAGRSSAMCW